MIEVEDLGHQLECASPILRSVRLDCVLEQLERLLERRQDDDWLGLGFRLGARAPSGDEGSPRRRRTKPAAARSPADDQDWQSRLGEIRYVAAGKVR